MGKKPRSELPKWNKRKKHKGQAPPRPLKDDDAAGKGRKRKRASSFSNDASDNKPPTTRYKKRKEQFETAKQKKSSPATKGGKGGKGAAKSGNVKPPQPVVEEEVEATEEDVQFFTENAENLAFLDSLPAQQLTESLYKKKKLRREDKKKMKLEENKLAAYEMKPRKNPSADDEAVKVEQVRLPVKDKEGLVLKVKVEGDELVPEHVRKLREKARRLAQGDVIEIDEDKENGKEKEAMEEDNEGELDEIEVKEEEEDEEEEELGGQADDSVELLEEKEEDDEEEEEDDEMDEDEEEEEEEEEGLVDFDEDEDDDEDDEDDDMAKSLKRMEKEQEHIEECKHRMAIIGSMIMTDSETNIVELKELLEMCRDNTFTVRKYALLSTLAVFKDIIPGYRIRMATEKEKQMKVSRDQKQMRDREAMLLNSYQQYLQMLDAILKGYRMHRQRVKRQRKNFGKKQANKPFNSATNTQDDDAYLLAQKKRAEVDEKIDKDVKEEWVIAIRCLSELLHSASHFNFSWNIVSLIVPLMNADDDKLSQLCCASVVSVFENDTRGSITLQTVKLISQLVKAKSFNVRNEVLATFLHIKFLDELKEGEVTLEPTRGLSKKEKSRMTKRKFKAYKEMREIEQEMREAEAEQTKEEKKRVQTEILRAAFVTYFRILKKAQKSPLLPSVLEGLARYTHFISVDFITDIVVALRELIGGRDFATQLSIPVRLQCAISALEMTQKGSQTYSTGNINVTADTVVHVDLKDLYTRLYEVLLEVPPHTIEHPSILLSLLRCLNLIARDRKQLSASRTAAFVKRIATLTLQLPPHATLGLLSILTDILNKHPKIQQLFDSDHDGSGVFMPELNDPEHCNALASTLWEFALLKSHYHPHLQEYTLQFLKFFEKQCQAIVGVAVPQQHALTAETLYSKFDYQASGLFNPPMQKPPPHPYDKLATKFSAKAARQGRKNREKKMYVKPKEQSDFYQFLTLSSEAEVDMNDFDSYAEELTSFWDLTQ